MVLNHFDQQDNAMGALIANDPELLDSAMSGKPLSESGVKKMKDFFLSNEDFKASMLSSFGQGQGADCFKGLTDAQKDKVFKVIVDHMPFTNMFVAGTEQEPNAEQIVKEMLADNELGGINNNFKVPIAYSYFEHFKVKFNLYLIFMNLMDTDKIERINNFRFINIRQKSMNSKGILVCIVMAFLLFAQIQGLTVKSHQVSKNTDHYKVQGLAHKTHYNDKQITLNHLNGQEEFKALIDSDPELFKNLMNNTPLSESGVKKIKDFYLSNQEFKTAALQKFGQGKGVAACFKGLTDAQKDKVYNIIIDKTPIVSMFVIDANRQRQKYNAQVEALLADQELGPLFAKCKQSIKKWSPK